MVQVDEAALERARQAWDGDLAARLPVLQTLDATRLGRLRNLALAEQFDEPGPRNDLAITHLEQAVTNAFLFDNLLRGEGGPARRPATQAVDRLRGYIEANWQKPLNIESLAQACGVSVRTVFLEFARQYGVTPMTYLRDLRLDRARASLSRPDSELSVIDVALRCGFASFGHFARRYRERFGELPSATLERARWR